MASEDGKQLVQWSFTNGINELERSELVDPVQGGFLTLENVRQRDVGALSKRPGYSALTATSSTMTRLFSVRDALAAAGPSGDGVKVYSETESAWNALSGVSYVADATRVPLSVAPGLQFSTADSAYANGYLVVCWCSINASTGTYGIYSAVYDATNWSCVAPAASLYGPYAYPVEVKMTSIGSKVYALFDLGGGATNLGLATINVTNGTTIGSGWSVITAASDYAVAGPYDIHVNASNIIVAYHKTGTVATLGFVKLTSTPSVVTSATYDLSGAPSTLGQIDGIGLGGDSSNVWIAVYDSTVSQVWGLVLDFSFGTTGTPGLVYPAVTTSRLGIALVGSTAYIIGSTLGSTFYKTATVTAGALVASGGGKHPNIAYGSRPFVYNSTPFEIAYPYSADSRFRTACLVKTVPLSNNYLSMVASPAPLVCADTSLGLQHVQQLSSTKFAALISPVRNQLSSGIDLVIFEFGHAQLFQPAPIADTSYLSGGVVTSLDGAQAMEPTSLHRPDLPVAVSAGGTGITHSVGWRYIAVFERVDSSGNLFWSALSDPSAIIKLANKSGATVTVATMQISNTTGYIYAGSSWSVAIYRTTDGGSTYYRVDTATNVPASASTVSFTDTLTDTYLVARAQLYRQPSVNGAPQNRELPPGLRYLITHNDRLIGAAPDGVSVWYSAKHVIGEGMWFSSLFQFPVEDGGAITGLASQFGRLVVFKRSSIFVVDGDGPSENGASGDFSLPNKLASDVGCIDARSICTCSAGVIFQSDRGIELLTPSLQVQWIGQKVQGTLRTYPVVTSAVFDAVNGYAYITCTTSDGTTGVTLVYDPVFQVWESIDKVYQNSTATAPATSACLAPVSGVPRYHRLYSGTVSRMSTSSYLDGSQWVTMKVETAWLKAAGLQGEQHVDRALFLGQKSTDHDLTISAGYNYVSSYPQTRTWSHTQVTSNVTDLSREQLELVSSNNARCQSVRFKIEDATPTSGTVGTGRAATWLGLSVETSPRPGRAKLPTSSR